MQISTRKSGDATILDLAGDITLYTTPQVRQTLLGLFREKDVRRVVVNMSGVRYIDSAGVASLVEALRLSRESKSGFALFGLNKVARQVLELTRLTKVFEIHETEEDALQEKGAGAA